MRNKLAKFMCHDTSTADRFYAMHLDAEQAGQIRVLFEQATAMQTPMQESQDSAVSLREEGGLQ